MLVLTINTPVTFIPANMAHVHDISIIGDAGHLTDLL